MNKEHINDFPTWYQKTILDADLADFSPVRGAMVIKPYGYAIWEQMQAELDKKIKKLGVQNAYFPLLIPERFITKEKEHVKGFAPEIAWVTEGGSKKLEERLAIRPTSETMIYYMYAKWVHSWRDLPIKMNQWANVMRWEKRTRFFLRTSEFLWQEGHCAFATDKEASENADSALQMYDDFSRSFLALPSLIGRKTDSEKFAGASYTLACEALMKDGKALQLATSHHLGQHFSKAFDISFVDKNEKNQFVWQTSWGMSTRALGALIMGHGDKKGLRLPPRIAPIQVVIIPIWKTDHEKKQVYDEIRIITKSFTSYSIRFYSDNRDHETPGYKFNEWEQKGVPLRIEIGPRDLKQKRVVIVRRDDGSKIDVPLAELDQKILSLLHTIQDNLLQSAQQFLDEHMFEPSNFREFSDIIKTKGGFVLGPWCSKDTCEKEIQSQTKATPRLIKKFAESVNMSCYICSQPTKHRVYYAKAY